MISDEHLYTVSALDNTDSNVNLNCNSSVTKVTTGRCGHGVCFPPHGDNSLCAVNEYGTLSYMTHVIRPGIRIVAQF
jgi:hypothetical protein